ncbi:MAG TPA: aspartate aminotransferase family protein [Actinomycetota bacterium]|nr:aspartate aminotransferase family protein [Actinomycetota bacterium]
MSNVFPRVLDRELPLVARGEGAVLWDADGRRYIDGAGGAVVVGVGHGRTRVVAAMTRQAERIAYAHPTAFSSDALESYAQELAPLLPMDEPRIYPVSGGSEAVETAIKLARTYHLARGEPTRELVIGRSGSYHGNTLGALDASGREPLRRPYEPWLGRFRHVPAAYEYRCSLPGHPDGCGVALAEALDAAILEAGAENVACFIAEPVAGATLGAAVPPDDYWPAIREVCDRHGVLLIADEVMTGFGRTGAWFASDHWGLKPDILTAGKGVTSGYWPLGFAACTGAVFDTVRPSGFVHGFTYSHSIVGAAVARSVLGILKDEHLVDASRDKGELLRKELGAALDTNPAVGDVRGLGLMVGIELVRDRATREPFPRADRVTERVVAEARERGVLLYSSTGCADGTNGDLVMFGPPFVVTELQIAEAVRITAEAIEACI